MVVGYDFWANYHYLMLAHSGQQLLLSFFIWALPDPKYQHWIKGKLWLFYTMSVLNMLVVFFGLFGGLYFYWAGPALYSFLASALLVYLTLSSGPLIFSIFVSFALVHMMFYSKP